MSGQEKKRYILNMSIIYSGFDWSKAFFSLFHANNLEFNALYVKSVVTVGNCKLSCVLFLLRMDLLC